MHLDGARLMNACVATGRKPTDYAKYFDTVSMCFSKGLGAPVGSALIGSRDAIRAARRFRKMLGGGMRQAGVLAAAALYALRHQRARLALDHEHARLLAESLQGLPELEVSPTSIETNIVLAHTPLTPAEELARRFAEVSVFVAPFAPRALRFVTHLDVERADVLEAAARIRTVLKRTV